MNIRLTAVTDVGKTRMNNEDAVAICANLGDKLWSPNGTSDIIPLERYGAMLVVADGMGGENAGEVASGIAIETITGFFSTERLESTQDGITDASISGLLFQAVDLADNAIKNRAATVPETMGMGTTMVIAWAIEDKVHIAWCGDSRCYLFNPKTGLRRLTKDHSYVQELVDKGEITEAQAFSHPDGNIITKCLGDNEASAELDVTTCPLQDGDTLLLCSDGLCGYCDDRAIERAVRATYDDLSLCKETLLQLALDAGGYDNITIAIAQALSNPSLRTEKAGGQAITSILTKFKSFLVKLWQ